MTAEVVIMNKECVALAADSAGTLTAEKIFNSSNKIFRLIKGLPMGLMVFNRAEFMGVPWETVIKLYRLYLEDQKKNFPTVESCSKDFCSFLILEFKNKEDVYFKTESFLILQNICGNIAQVCSYIEELNEKDLSDTEIQRITQKTINDYYNGWTDSPLIESILNEDVIAIKVKYQKYVQDIIKKIYSDLPVTEELSAKLEEIVFGIFTKGNINSPLFSGIIIAGFGDQEIYPSEKTIIVQGVLNNKLLFYENETKSICYNTVPASIRSYAQSEMVSRFMNGIDPDYFDQIDIVNKSLFYEYPYAILDGIEKLLLEKQVIKELPVSIKNEMKDEIKKIADVNYEKCKNFIEQYQYMTFNKTILDVVESLPKDEIASMAESLVNLTSFKRRVSMQAPSVGGPIDVAVISKKDGFVWIKRKHYFNHNLNPHFGDDGYLMRGDCGL
jgi:hypothetical protein